MVFFGAFNYSLSNNISDNSDDEYISDWYDSGRYINSNDNRFCVYITDKRIF